ncbi:MAG: FtsQ-type POTRA domain-containing protein [bacterium]|nr:FtsQ-type POTRA domain-containing protein [bacterium]
MKNYRKPYRVKRKKPILRNRFFWIVILTFTVLAGISYFLFFSPFFQISNIAITGNSAVLEENIKAFIPAKNIFLIDAEIIRKDILDNFPQVAGVKIHKRLPDALSVAISERSAVALWCEEEKCFFIDKEAVVFKHIADEGLALSGVEGLIKIAGAREILNKEKISQILDIQKKIRERSIATTTQANIVSEERLNVRTSEGWEIYFNLRGNLDWQIQELDLVLEKQISPEKRKILDYIDLRFSRVYYK